MFITREILSTEIDDAIKLSEYAFKYSLKGEDREKRVQFMSDHQIFGVFDNGKMIAKTHILPLKILINSNTYSMGGIASVATYPEYRRKGIINNLMKLCLRSMNENGNLISYLHPFEVNFYRKYGYELISNYKKTTIMKKDLQFYKGVRGNIVRPNATELKDDISNIYNQFIEEYNGMMMRSDKWWQNNIIDSSFQPAVYYDMHGIAKGYLYFKINEDTLEVQEFIYLDEDSRKGLWNFISNHDSMIESAVITTTEHEKMSFMFYNPAVKTEIIPDFMGRIVNVMGFLYQYFDLTALNQSLKLIIKDSQAPWNSGEYILSNEGITFCSYADEDFNVDEHQNFDALTMSINTLTALLLGSQTIEFLYKHEAIIGSENACAYLGEYLTKKSCAYMDYF